MSRYPTLHHSQITPPCRMKDPGIKFINTRQSERLRHLYDDERIFTTYYRGDTYSSRLRKGRDPWTYFTRSEPGPKKPTHYKRKKSTPRRKKSKPTTGRRN